MAFPNLLIWAALVILTLYFLIVLFVWQYQRRLLYFPSKVRVAPSTVGLQNVEEVILNTPDGAELVAWYGQAESGKPTILYFHGNRANLAGRAEAMKNFLKKGRGCFLFSYRGYSGSTGRPSEKSNFADAQLAVNYLNKRGVLTSSVIVYGESLGTGVAAYLAAQPAVSAKLAGLCLSSPYSSIVDVAARIYWFVPVRVLLRDRYDTVEVIDRVQAPLLIVHGAKDELIPLAMAKLVLASTINARSRDIFIAPDAAHDDIWLHENGPIDCWINRIWPKHTNKGEKGC